MHRWSHDDVRGFVFLQLDLMARNHITGSRDMRGDIGTKLAILS
jgi:hypothetical protein